MSITNYIITTSSEYFCSVVNFISLEMREDNFAFEIFFVKHLQSCFPCLNLQPSNGDSSFEKIRKAAGFIPN